MCNTTSYMSLLLLIPDGNMGTVHSAGQDAGALIALLSGFVLGRQAQGRSQARYRPGGRPPSRQRGQDRGIPQPPFSVEYSYPAQVEPGIECGGTRAN